MKTLRALGRMSLDAIKFIGKGIAYHAVWLIMVVGVAMVSHYATDRHVFAAQVVYYGILLPLGIVALIGLLIVACVAVEDWFRRHYY